MYSHSYYRLLRYNSLLTEVTSFLLRGCIITYKYTPSLERAVETVFCDLFPFLFLKRRSRSRSVDNELKLYLSSVDLHFGLTTGSIKDENTLGKRIIALFLNDEYVSCYVQYIFIVWNTRTYACWSWTYFEVKVRSKVVCYVFT